MFYFTPGSRYLRTVEHLFFGETYLGYVSLLLLLPFLVFCLFRRYFTARTALAIALIFIAIPVGALFGSTFYHLRQARRAWLRRLGRGRAFPCRDHRADRPLAAGTRRQFAPAFGAALLFAVAVCVRPNLAIGAAVLLGGAGLAALWQRQGWRLAGMCIGFLPVFSMALHNWYYGGVFVLFSRHTNIAAAMPMPPHAYVGALWELLRLDFAGGDLARGALQIRRLLIGPSESIAMIPLHAAALAVVVRVLLSRRYEGWLRLIAAATLGLYTPALFFVYSDRYSDPGLAAHAADLFAYGCGTKDCPGWTGGFPASSMRARRQPVVVWLTRRLDGLARAAGMMPRAALSRQREERPSYPRAAMRRDASAGRTLPT